MGNKKLLKFIYTLVGILIICFHLAPLYIVTVISLKTKNDLTLRWQLPDYLYLDNFTRAIAEANLLEAFKNSFLITTVATLLIVFLGSMAAYPLSRLKTKMSKFVLILVLAVMMIPTLSVIVPLYSVMADISALNTFWGVILVLTAYNIPMGIFLYTNFIGVIPRALDEAATVDGCSGFGVFLKIILPQLKPVTATVIILTGIKNWNDFEFALYFLQKPGLQTLTLTIRRFFSEFSSEINVAAAAALLSVIPVLIVFIFLQKYFISGMSDGAVK